MDRRLDYPVFDADNHMYEQPDAFTRYLPDEYKNVIKYVQVNGRDKLAIKNVISEYIPNPTFTVVARPGAQEEFFKHGNPEGKSRREILGKPMQALEAFFRPEPRLELMDEQGVDRAIMWPTLASVLEERLHNDPEASTSSSTRSTSGCTRSGPSTTRIASSRLRSSPCRSWTKPFANSTGWSSVAPRSSSSVPHRCRA